MKALHRWWLPGAVAVTAVGAALAIQIVAASGTTARSGRLAIHTAALEPPAREVRGDVLVTPGGRAQKLATTASTPLVGEQAPAAAVSPDGTYLAYNSFAAARPIDRMKSLADQGIATGDPLGTPRIRLHNLATGAETALEPGSQSLAWRTDGALAYAVGKPPPDRANLPYLTNVVVRSRADAAPVAWTSDADRYTVLAWAGSTLVVQRDAAGAAPDILALDAPGQVRPLATESSFLGVSANGTQALIAESPAATPTPRVLLVRIADGTTLASIYVADARDPVSGEPSTWILGPASWIGDHVVAASSTGLVILSTSGGLRVDQVLHLDAATKPNAVLFEPRFIDADARTIAAWGGIPGTQPVQIAQYACDRYALTCTRGPALAADDPPRPVYDLSGGTR